MTTRFTRRAAMRAGLAAVAAPAVWRNGRAADAIRIGAPIALTGPLGSVGQQMKRGCEFWAKWQNAKGGLLGRPIEMVFADTAGDPAACVRKAQEMVERDGIRILTAITLSSEALATVPKLAEWDTIFMSSDNGDGRLTAESFVPNFFRANISGPMGTRAVALWLRESKMQNFYAHRPRLRLGPQQHRRVRVRGEEGEEELRRRGVFAGRHQGLLDLHHQDPPVRRRCLLHRDAGRRQQRLPVAVARIPAAATRCSC